MSHRLRIYRQGTGEVRNEVDCKFWDTNPQIEELLAGYIRAHDEQFRSLEDVSHESSERNEITSESELSTSAMYLQAIPHWARIAFAARCANHVLELFDRNWPNATDQYRSAVTTAIGLAKESAAMACSVEQLDDAELGAIMTAGRAMYVLYGIAIADQESLPPDGNMAVVASSAANSAAKAAAAAQGTPEESVGLAMQSLMFAESAASDDHELVAKMRTDLNILVILSDDQQWPHDAPLASDFFETFTNTASNAAKPWWKFW